MSKKNLSYVCGFLTAHVCVRMCPHIWLVVSNPPVINVDRNTLVFNPDHMFYLVTETLSAQRQDCCDEVNRNPHFVCCLNFTKNPPKKNLQKFTILVNSRYVLNFRIFRQGAETSSWFHDYRMMSLSF